MCRLCIIESAKVETFRAHTYWWHLPNSIFRCTSTRKSARTHLTLSSSLSIKDRKVFTKITSPNEVWIAGSVVGVWVNWWRKKLIAAAGVNDPCVVVGEWCWSLVHDIRGKLQCQTCHCCQCWRCTSLNVETFSARTWTYRLRKEVLLSLLSAWSQQSAIQALRNSTDCGVKTKSDLALNSRSWPCDYFKKLANLTTTVSLSKIFLVS